MRITYGRPERMIRFQELLKKEQLEYFLPMRVDYQKTDDWNVRKSYVPAVNGLIFIHSTQEELTNIPDRQMDNFMSVYTRNDSRISLLEYTDFIAKPGKRVRITQGDFENTIGTIKRIKKNQCIVVQLEGFTALAIAFVPPSWLEELSESDYQALMEVKK